MYNEQNAQKQNAQNRGQGGLTHTNFNDQVKKPGLIAVKKAQATRFVAKTKVRLEQAKKTSKKVLYFAMMFYVIISAIITSVFLTSPLNHLYTYKNSENVETLRNATSYEVDEMINSYKRVDERTTEERKNEIEKQFQEVSDATNLGIKTAQAAAPTSTVEIITVEEASTVRRDVSAYNLVVGQTDGSPCIGAAGQNLCYLMRTKKMNVCAANRYKFGTVLKIPGYLGSQGDGKDDTCVVLDVLSPKYGDRVDVCMDQDIKRAKIFGVQPINVTVVGYVKNWANLARTTEPSR